MYYGKIMSDDDSTPSLFFSIAPLLLKLSFSHVYTFRGSKMNDVSVLLEHVDFLNGLHGLDVQPLKRRLQLFVVRACALVDLLDLPPGCALATRIAHPLARFTPHEAADRGRIESI